MKIGLCGTMSVGKTTLVNALKELEQFKGYKFATERSQHLMSLGIPLNTDSTLKGQTVFLAERCGELMYDNIITDRTIIDVMAFTQCASSIDSIDKKAFEEYARNFIREYDYIFYVSPEGIDMEDNGVRETNLEYRNLIDYTIQNILSSQSPRAKNITTITGTTEERIAQILNSTNS